MLYFHDIADVIAMEYFWLSIGIYGILPLALMGDVVVSADMSIFFYKKVGYIIVFCGNDNFYFSITLFWWLYIWITLIFLVVYFLIARYPSTSKNCNNCRILCYRYVYHLKCWLFLCCHAKIWCSFHNTSGNKIYIYGKKNQIQLISHIILNETNVYHPYYLDWN